MVRIAEAALLFLLAFGVTASAQVGQIAVVVTPGGAPACTNELDFSNACNSQYLAVVP